jgi:N-acetyl-anhydromuramyl-L-alanine amidase AmpD
MTMMQWTPAKKVVAACAVLGLGLLIATSRRRYRDHNGAPVALDPELDSDTRRVVLAALVRESDPMVLHLLATKLDAAGYDESARVVRERRAHVARVNSHHVGQSEPYGEREVRERLSSGDYSVGQSRDGNAHLEHSFGHSAMVWHAQSMLRKLGYDVQVNGIEDAATTLAVKRFQSLHDLDIDGVIDPRTNAALAAAVREGN